MEDQNQVITKVSNAYKVTAKWFAQRLALGLVTTVTVWLGFGVFLIFHYWEPISESQLYGVVQTRSAQVIDVASPIFTKLLWDYREPDVAKGIIDPRAEQHINKVEMLRQYFKGKKSPFAEDEAALQAFAESKNMKMMIAISFVESTFGKRCYYNNCSGIGGYPPNLRKYDSYADWIRDFDSLLERRYKNLPPEKFLGLYVQPGSPNWIYGVNKVLKEFEVLEAEHTNVVEITGL